MTNVVVDTNVLVSSALVPVGNPAKIIDLIRVNAVIQVYYSIEILAEYSDVLSRPRLNIAADKQTRAIGAIIKAGILVDPVASKVPLPDESDRIFYDAAREGGAILITGNLKHYPDEEFIMTPSQFLDSLSQADWRDARS